MTGQGQPKLSTSAFSAKVSSSTGKTGGDIIIQRQATPSSQMSSDQSRVRNSEASTKASNVSDVEMVDWEDKIMCMEVSAKPANSNTVTKSHSKGEVGVAEKAKPSESVKNEASSKESKGKTSSNSGGRPVSTSSASGKAASAANTSVSVSEASDLCVIDLDSFNSSSRQDTSAASDTRVVSLCEDSDSVVVISDSD